MIDRNDANEGPRRAVLYTRVSTRGQADDGVSLDAQLDQLHKYCAWRGFEIVGEFIDAGVSGKRQLEHRPEAAKLLKAIAAGEADCIIAVSLDRLFRNLSECASKVEAWRNGPLLLTLREGIDTSSSMSRFIVNIAASVAQMEREQLGERVSEALQHMKSNGQKYTSRVYGYKIAGDRVAPNANERRVIERMLSLRAEGSTLGEIAGILNDDGVPAPNLKRWHAETIRRIIKREQQEQRAGK